MIPHDVAAMVTGPVLAFAGAVWMHRRMYARVFRALADALDAPPGTALASEATAVAVDLGVPPTVAATLANSLPPAIQRAQRLLDEARAVKASTP